MTTRGCPMSHPNTQSRVENEPEKLDAEYELCKHWPSIRFREHLLKDKLFWTHNWQDFYLLQEMFDYEAGEYINHVTAALRVEYTPNTYLDTEIVKQHVVHLNYICIRNEWRGVGALRTVCTKLIQAAEDTNVVLVGHARPFYIDLPELTNQDDVKQWERDCTSSHNKSLKQDKINAKKLLPKYLDYGFCKYDGTGVRFGNRWWKRMCFAYKGSNIQDRDINKFYDNHLLCN